MNQWKRYGVKIFLNGVKMIGFLFLLSFLVFFMARMAPGDPLKAYYGERIDRMTMEERQRAIEKLGINEPFIKQYSLWVKGVMKGEVGISYQYKQPVMKVIKGVIGNTILLAGSTYIFTFLLAFLLAIFCVYYEQSLLERFLCKVGTIFTCIPSFWLALLFILIFSVNLKWFPSSGAYTAGGERTIKDLFLHLVLPLVVLILEHLWYYAYLLRNRLIEETRKGYVTFALGKGIPRWRVLVFHCARGAMPSYLSLMALSVPHILGGTYIVEKVFSYPGLGTLCFESAKYHDYNLLMMLTIITAFFVLVSSMIAKVLSECIDHRMRRE